MLGGKIVDDEATPVVVSFYEHARRVGFDKWINVDYIKTKAPGVRDFMSRAATDDDKAEHPEAWDAYQRGQVGEEEGNTPLTLLPSHKTAFAMEFKSMGVESIEVLGARDKPGQDYLIPMWKQAKKYITLLEDDDSE
jgi:hypothetical protein